MSSRPLTQKKNNESKEWTLYMICIYEEKQGWTLCMIRIYRFHPCFDHKDGPYICKSIYEKVKTSLSSANSTDIKFLIFLHGRSTAHAKGKFYINP